MRRKCAIEAWFYGQGCASDQFPKLLDWHKVAQRLAALSVRSQVNLSANDSRRTSSTRESALVLDPLDIGRVLVCGVWSSFTTSWRMPLVNSAILDRVQQGQ